MREQRYGITRANSQETLVYRFHHFREDGHVIEDTTATTQPLVSG